MSAKEQRYLIFSLSGEKYAIPLLKTREVIPFSETTPVPYTPSYFRGILNLRGQVISVLDLRVKLKLSHVEFSMETAIIVLDLSAQPVGVVVDSVDSVAMLKPAEISAMPLIETSLAPECLIGVARREDSLILLLDIEKTVNLEELRRLSSTRAA